VGAVGTSRLGKSNKGENSVMRVLGTIAILIGVFLLTLSLATWRPFRGYALADQVFIAIGAVLLVGGTMLYRASKNRSK